MTKELSFNEKLFKHAWDLAGQKAQFESEMSVYRNFGIECGEWARAETIANVVQLLCSARLFEVAEMVQYQMTNVHQEFTKGTENER